MTELESDGDGGYFVPDEYAMPIIFKVKYPDKRIQKKKNKRGIRARLLRLLGSEDGYIWVDTQEYLEFKAEWERQHTKVGKATG